MSALDLVYLDDQIIVLNKASGLLSVPGRGEDKQDCLITRAQKEWSDALTVHRLDMATSGLVVMGRGPDIQRRLSQAFALREVHKTYEAIVAGLPHISETWHNIQLPLIIDWPNRPRSKVDWEQGKPSHTQWRVKQVLPLDHASRVELKPITGRTHQLRLHMMAIGHPILGDALYASPEELAKAPRLLLHARELQLKHPVTAKWMVFETSVPF